MGCCSRTTLLHLGWATGLEFTIKVCDLLNPPFSVTSAESCGWQKYIHIRHNYTQVPFGAFLLLSEHHITGSGFGLLEYHTAPHSSWSTFLSGEPPRVTKQRHTLEERNPLLPRCSNPRTHTYYLLLTLKFSVLTSSHRSRTSNHFSPFQSLTPDFFYNVFPLFSSWPILVSFLSYLPIRFILFYSLFHSCMLHDQPFLPFYV
jgi:hypothetical protein